MLKPIIKESGVTARERHLARLSENSFFGLWSFPNVYTDEGKSKTGRGKELCDLLVVFEKNVIIFSDKDIAFNENIDINIAWKRWFKKAVIKSCDQLYGAESWVRRFPSRIYLDRDCANLFPLDLSSHDLRIFLIAITCNSTKPAKEFFGGHGSGSMFQNFPLSAKECLDAPFFLGNLFPRKRFVHVLDEWTVELLLSELNTISDFITYLAEKERVILSGEILCAAGEEELLAHYLMGQENIKSFGAMTLPKDAISSCAMLGEGLWDGYRQSYKYKIRSLIARESLFWDELIHRFSRHILDANVGRGGELPFDYHERAVRHLATENRASRYLLSQSFIDKFNAVPRNRRSGRSIFAPNNPDKLYVFIFIPRDQGQSYEDYREERLFYMKAYSLVSKYLNPMVTNVVVIATEPREAIGRSEDIYSVEYGSNTLSTEEQQTAESLIKEKLIFSDIKKVKTNPLTKQMGYKEPYRNMDKRYGRNEKCPCGSGKKYKRCCMN